MSFINKNPFCVLGISPNASEREIQKQVTKTTRFAEIDKKISFDTDFLFLGKIKRDKVSISNAYSEIEQPLNRLLHSLFWFWNSNHIDEAAFDKLSSDHKDKAREIWEKVVKDGDVSSKNLSCLFNLKSLIIAQSFKEDSIDSELLIKGVLLSGKFLNHSALDSYTKQIIGNHINVSSEELEIKYITSIYNIVKPFLNKKNGITTENFLSSFATFSKKSREYISTKFTGDPINKIRDQINTTSELRKQNPLEALSLGEALHKNTKSQLKSLSEILRKEDLKYQMLASKLADEILQCGIDYFNKIREEGQAENDDGKKVLKLCKLAKKIVSGIESQTNARIDENQQIISDWVNDNSRELIAAFNKAMEVYESFDNWKGSGVQGPPGAWDWGRPDLIEAANTLVKFIKKSIKNPDFVGEEFLSFCDQVAQLVTVMAIKHANHYQHNSHNMYECRDLLRSILNIEMTPKTNSHLKKNLAIIERNVEINGGNTEEARFKKSQNLTRVENNSGCYIATMVYGDYNHPQVLVLRDFRDSFLTNFYLGRAFIKLYYQYSPGWVKALENKKTFNKIIKGILNISINFIR